MLQHRNSFVCLFYTCLLYCIGTQAYAESCSSLKSYKFNETWKAKYEDILKCYRNGIDPPKEWRPGGGQGISEGERGAAASASDVTGWRAPENPPIGGGPSISSAMQNWASSFPKFPAWSRSGSSNSKSGARCVTVYATPGTVKNKASCTLAADCIPDDKGELPDHCTLPAGCPSVTVCPKSEDKDKTSMNHHLPVYLHAAPDQKLAMPIAKKGEA